MKRTILLTSFALLIILNHSSAQYVLYGTTSSGGIYNKGVIFKFNPFTGKDTVVLNFNGVNGQEPNSSLMQATDGLLYGETGFGGSDNKGVFFNFNPITYKENVLVNFNGPNGDWSQGDVPFDGRNGKLYATTFNGGMYNDGVILSYDINHNKDSILFSFDSLDGLGNGRNFISGTNNLFYGVTEFGGTKNDGVMYSFDTSTGIQNILIDFTGLNGEQPNGLCKANNGFFYGTTFYGGTLGYGVIYSYNPIANKDTILLNFNDTNGALPNGNNLFQATNGLLYGMTYEGGIGNSNNGVFFSFNPITNHQNILINFSVTNGEWPLGSLIEDTTRGLLYGMTGAGGKYNDGVIFSYDINTGKDSVLFNFNGSNGGAPLADVLMVKDATIGISEIGQKKGDVKVFPNPNNGQFTISILNTNEKSNIEIYNMLGESIYQVKLYFNNTEINLNGQPEGVYFYRVTNEDGGLDGSGKVIIEK